VLSPVFELSYAITMPFSWASTKRPILALAPMAGVTDASFRQLVKKVAPEAIVYTEFLSSDAISYGAERTLRMLSFDPEIERPFIVQIFGADPLKFLEACRVIEQIGADGIDINMGCPAAKIVSSCYGSALIREPKLAAELVHAATKAVSIPVSVKTRLGWDTSTTLIPFCKGLVDAGAKALSIHGRTYTGKFTGKADWEPMYALKKEVNVPVIGNGDVASAADAVAKIGNLDGVMVGRATFGNPWLMRDIADALHAKKLPSQTELTEPERRAVFQKRIPFILEHCDLAVRIKGEKRGVLEMRRHLSSYVKGFDGAKELRTKLLTLEKLDDVRTTLSAVA
jgi:tRNA-dihydrouridine synthase B